MSEKQRHLVFLGFGAFGLLVVILIVLSFLLPSPKETPTSPPPSNQNIKSNPANIAAIKTALMAKMPIQKEAYIIEYLDVSDEFVVTIKKNPYEENKKVVEDWLTSQGVTNLNDFKIVFRRDRWIE